MYVRETYDPSRPSCSATYLTYNRSLPCTFSRNNSKSEWWYCKFQLYHASLIKASEKTRQYIAFTSLIYYSIDKYSKLDCKPMLQEFFENRDLILSCIKEYNFSIRRKKIKSWHDKAKLKFEVIYYWTVCLSMRRIYVTLNSIKFGKWQWWCPIAYWPVQDFLVQKIENDNLDNSGETFHFP